MKNPGPGIHGHSFITLDGGKACLPPLGFGNGFLVTASWDQELVQCPQAQPLVQKAPIPVRLPSTQHSCIILQQFNNIIDLQWRLEQWMGVVDNHRRGQTLECAGMSSMWTLSLNMLNLLYIVRTLILGFLEISHNSPFLLYPFPWILIWRCNKIKDIWFL